MGKAKKQVIRYAVDTLVEFEAGGDVLTAKDVRKWEKSLRKYQADSLEQDLAFASDMYIADAFKIKKLNLALKLEE